MTILMNVLGPVVVSVVCVAALWLGAASSRRRRARERAAVDSAADMGWLMERERAGYQEQMRVMDRRLARAYEEADAQGARAMWAELRVAIVTEQRDEARVASALALRFYGREVEKREAVELELFRERLVSAGLESLLGVGEGVS